MIYDGECGFCRFGMRQLAVKGVDYKPFQDAAIQEQFPEIPKSEFHRSIQYIEPTGTVYTGAEAVFRSLAVDSRKRKRMFLWLYRKIPGAAFVSETGYKAISKHREFLSLFVGNRCETCQ